MSYNPADYKAVENTANVMDKKELETYYVKDKDAKHFNCCEIIGMIIGILVMIFILGFAGYTIAEGIIEKDVSDNLYELSEEICPILGEGYSSSKFFKSTYLENRIICNELNSIPK